MPSISTDILQTRLVNLNVKVIFLNILEYLKWRLYNQGWNRSIYNSPCNHNIAAYVLYIYILNNKQILNIAFSKKI